MAAIDLQPPARRGEAERAADPDEAAVIALLADILVGDNHWTVGELRRLVDLRDATQSDRERATTEDPETALR